MITFLAGILVGGAIGLIVAAIIAAGREDDDERSN